MKYKNGITSRNLVVKTGADFFLPFRTRRKALKLLREGRIHLLGTDAHNMASRAPRMAEAVAMIQKHLGPDPLHEIDRLGERLLWEGGL